MTSTCTTRKGRITRQEVTTLASVLKTCLALFIDGEHSECITRLNKLSPTGIMVAVLGYKPRSDFRDSVSNAAYTEEKPALLAGKQFQNLCRLVRTVLQDEVAGCSSTANKGEAVRTFKSFLKRIDRFMVRA